MSEENKEIQQLKDCIAAIGGELFRFQRVFERAISGMDLDEQNKYMRQFAWFSKKVTRGMEAADLRVLSLEGLEYDPGMAVTPLNIDEFEPEEPLYIQQMMEPIIMQGTEIYKAGTAMLGRYEA